jgi:hypothetical protein
MLFQSLDDKIHCIGIYYDGKLVFDEIPDGLTATWSYNSGIESIKRDIEYAQLYCGGKSLSEACPEPLMADWERIESKMKAFIRSFVEAGVSFNEHCFYDLVPPRFLLEYCDLKNQICEHVIETYEKPQNYNFLAELSFISETIASNPLNLQTDVLKSQLQVTKIRNFWKKSINMSRNIRYNIYGTRTGRLTTTKSSFPILTMDKDFRKVIRPKNDWFVELDFNAAELRTLLALSGKKQPEEDLHEWNRKNVFEGKGTRDDAKKRIFAWLYNPASKDYLSGRAYSRSDVLSEYWNGQEITTPFDRTIKADGDHALNYIIQSTTSDLLLSQMIEVNNFLEGKDSHVSFCIHDNVVLDMTEEDCKKLPEIVRIFANTKLGKYKVNVRAGKNFGDMKEINNASLQ